ncbi:MAG: hypothetical protein GXY59_11480 [Bacteroidales bacterium]|jgi:hypothetical protein|nr:hypothetical protein [Bacteroidales bacterium]
MQALLTDELNQYSTNTVMQLAEDKSSLIWHFRIRNLIAPNSTVFPDLLSFPPVIISFIQKLDSYINLNDNWDSYGAVAPSVISIRNARRFLINNANVSLPYYFISPGVNGEVMIELSKGRKAAEIYFNSDKSTELLLFENNNCLLESNLKDSIKELIKFFND